MAEQIGGGAMEQGDRLGPWLKGFPATASPVARADIAARRWNVLAGDLPLPLAVLRRSALAHNIAWMQAFATARGVQLAPHGKTTMSPQLFERQITAGAWGITFGNVFQLRTGVVSGVRRALVANQVHQRADLDALAALRVEHPDLQVAFLVDSREQLALIEAWRAAAVRPPVLDVLLEIGIDGGRTGVREHDVAVTLARALRASAAVRLVGIECYEGLQASGDGARDAAHVDALLQRVSHVAEALDREGLFEADEVIVSAGGSAVFDLVAARLPLSSIGRPVRPLLRSGCYVTHDHGHYQRYVAAVNQRCGVTDGLRGAIELWTEVQSTPEPGLALLTAGRRDAGFDAGLPVPLHHARRGAMRAEPADAAWQVSALNDQHAYLHLHGGTRPVAVGDRIALGIQHPCTTFDKWHWMPIVDDDYGVVDAVTIHF